MPHSFAFCANEWDASIVNTLIPVPILTYLISIQSHSSQNKGLSGAPGKAKGSSWGASDRSSHKLNCPSLRKKRERLGHPPAPVWK